MFARAEDAPVVIGRSSRGPLAFTCTRDHLAGGSAMAAVIDGFGGEGAAALIADSIESTIAQALLGVYTSSDPEAVCSAMAKAFSKMDDSLLRSKVQSGCSTGAIVVLNGFAFCANIGGTKVILSRNSEVQSSKFKVAFMT